MPEKDFQLIWPIEIQDNSCKIKLWHKNQPEAAPPPQNLPQVLGVVKSAYILWQNYITVAPKTSRYTLVETIDKYFIQTIENILIASFLEKQDKLPFIRKAIISFDTLKYLLYILWGIKALDTKKYIALSEPLAEAGKQLGGWYGKIKKATAESEQ